jgi:tetratricopeptide (TPR) repeat protein
MRRGQLDAALRDVDSALTQQQNHPEWTARFRVQKGHVLMLRGAYSASLQLLNRSLPDSLSRSDAEVQRKMVQGLDYKYLQQFAQAEQAISDAEKLAADIHSQFLGDVAQARGMLESDLREYPKAAAAFQHVLTLARQQRQPFREALALGNLGDVAMQEEHYDEAIEWFRLAMQKSQSSGSLSSLSTTFGNMGWNYSVVGDFENAEDLLKSAVRHSTEAGQEADRAYWMATLASNVYYPTHQYSKAQEIALQAWDLAKGGDDQSTRTTCLNTLSQIALATGRPHDAEGFNRQAVEIENAGRDQFGINYSHLIAGRIATANRDYSAAVTAFRKVLADKKAETPLQWEAHARLAEAYAEQHQPARAEQEFAVAIRTVQDALASVHRDEFRLSFLSSAIDFYDAYVNFLIDQRRPGDALKIADLSRAQPIEQNLSVATAPRAAFAPQLTARRLNSTLLFYWLGQQKSWLWVITPAKTSLIPLPPSGTLDQLVKSYRKFFLEDPRDPRETENADGKRLYAALVQPAEELMLKNGRVILLPDGTLNSLNFETLIVSAAQAQERAHYWIEDATLTTANSLSLLARSSVMPPPKTGRMLLVGKAILASPDFPVLPQGD